MPAAVMLVLALGSAALAGQPETPTRSDEASRWPTSAELRATLAGFGYEFREDGLSSPWSGTGFWTGARSDLADLPSDSGYRWLRVDEPDEAAARIWLLLANDDRVADLLDVGSVLGIPRPALDEASALVRISDEWTDAPDCAFFEWHVSGGRMVLWRDGPAADSDFEIAFEPPPADQPPGGDARGVDVIPTSASEACGATDQPPTTAAPDGDSDPVATFSVEAGDLWFRPAEVTVSGTGSTTLRLENGGRVVHNLTVDELAIQIVVTARATGEVILTDLTPGVYEFYCSISGHREGGMVGTLTVE